MQTCRASCAKDMSAHHKISRRFFDPEYTGHPNDRYDVPLHLEVEDFLAGSSTSVAKTDLTTFVGDMRGTKLSATFHACELALESTIYCDVCLCVSIL